MNTIDAVIYGVAAGDALGNPVQFFPREKVKECPVTDMRGGGYYHKKAGTWTDDTSMTLCLADSLGQLKDNEDINYRDIMDRFVEWLFNNEYTPHEKTFDVGRTCMEGIFNYIRYNVEPLKCGGIRENQNGNGSLMRIAPLVFYIQKKFGTNAFNPENPECEKAFETVHNVSRLTHAHETSLIGCDIYIAMLLEILKGTKKEDLRKTVLPLIVNYAQKHQEYKTALDLYSRIWRENFTELAEDEIKSSGYVVDTLEAALWSFLTTNSYEECLLKAVNLGWDADSVGAVAGGIAGLYYAEDKEKCLPEKWRKSVRNHRLIDKIAGNLGETLCH